jgi:uncharacterized membrane-anchored protein YjiN (DUF445 family)
MAEASVQPPAQQRVGSWAVGMLVLALVLATVGSILERTHVSPFWGGLILAFGEAALIGGLADWFAVRALFAHPLGIRIFPHTALIPRNRARITREISNLVQNEWLTKEMMLGRLDAFDFVGDGLLSLVSGLKPKLQPVVRTVAREILTELPAQELAGLLTEAATHSLDARRVAPFLAEVIHRVRVGGWLDPVMREMVVRFQTWAGSAENRAVIHRHLKEAAGAYCRKGVWKSLTYNVAEWSGGIDLEDASAVLQEQASRFAEEQLSEQSQLHQVIRDGLEQLEQRLRDDPEFAERLQSFVRTATDSGLLASAVGPFLTALQAEGLRAIEAEGSPVLVWVQGRLEGWVERLAQDPEARERVNAWCRRMAHSLVEKHHSLIGAMVEDRLSRFSDENLVNMIQAKVGEDLNWIRINGSLVGGFVGVVIYLAITVTEALLHGLSPLP